jgi:hypothetical protein
MLQDLMPEEAAEGLLLSAIDGSAATFESDRPTEGVSGASNQPLIVDQTPIRQPQEPTRPRHPDLITFAQKLNQWAQRHLEGPVIYTYTDLGPDHDRRYVTTCILNGTTEVVGNQERTEEESRESAASKALMICRLWEPEGIVNG